MTNLAPPFPDVGTLLPHRPPMRFVERIVALEDGELRCLGVLPAWGSFAGGATAPATLGLELAAQATALLAALTHPQDGAPPIGYLVSIRDAVFAAPSLPAGEPLLATARLLSDLPPMAMYAVTLTLAAGAPTAASPREPLLTATLGTYVAVVAER